MKAGPPHQSRKNSLNRCGAKRGIPRRILNVAVTQVGLDRPRVVAIGSELIAAGVAEHVGVALMPRSAAVAARSTMRENPGGDSGAPRSETNTNGDDGLSR